MYDVPVTESVAIAAGAERQVRCAATTTGTGVPQINPSDVRASTSVSGAAGSPPTARGERHHAAICCSPPVVTATRVAVQASESSGQRKGSSAA